MHQISTNGQHNFSLFLEVLAVRNLDGSSYDFLSNLLLILLDHLLILLSFFMPSGQEDGEEDDRKS